MEPNREFKLGIRVYPYKLFSISPADDRAVADRRFTGDASVPSLDDLRVPTLEKFSKNACNFQLEFLRVLLEEKKHALLQAGCGMEKTLGFRIPLLAMPSGGRAVL